MGASRAALDLTPRVFTESQFELLARLTDLIIPATYTCGAVGAGVPEYIDSALASLSEAEWAYMAGGMHAWSDTPAVLFTDGFQWIDDQSVCEFGHRFLELERQQQFDFLRSMFAAAEKPASAHLGRGVQFLTVLKNLTVHGYYSSEDGLITELGYREVSP